MPTEEWSKEKKKKQTYKNDFKKEEKKKSKGKEDRTTEKQCRNRNILKKEKICLKKRQT